MKKFYFSHLSSFLIFLCVFLTIHAEFASLFAMRPDDCSLGIITGETNLCVGPNVYQFQNMGATSLGQWTSLNESVATVNISGEVKAVGPGSTKIRYTISSNCDASGAEFTDLDVTVISAGEIAGANSLSKGGFAYPNAIGATEGGVCSVSKILNVGILNENVEFNDEYQLIVPGTNPLMDVCTQVGTIVSPEILNSYSPYIRLNADLFDGILEYSIRPDAGEDFAADLVLYYYQEDFDFFNKTSAIKLPTSPEDRPGILNLRILHQSDGGYPDEILRPASVTWNSSKLRWEVAFSVTHFSYFYLDAVDSQLPVTLVSFKALKQENDVALNWVTAMETNSEAFEIQHSTNGKQWQKLGTVQAEGESQTDKKYSYLDKNPSKGDNFYRLKMIDQASSGTEQAFTFSKIQRVNFEQGFAANIFPNPATEHFTIETSDWEMVRSIKIYDLNGTAVYKSAGNRLSKTIDVKSIPEGAYSVELRLKNGNSNTSKIVIAS